MAPPGQNVLRAEKTVAVATSVQTIPVNRRCIAYTVTTAAPHMSKKPKGKGQKTRMIRAREDLAEMFSWVCRAEGVKSSTLLDIVLRPVIVERFAEIYPRIVDLKKKDDAAAIASGRQPGPPLPVIDSKLVHGALKKMMDSIGDYQKTLDDLNNGEFKGTPEEAETVTRELTEMTARLREIYGTLQEQIRKRQQDMLDQL